MRLAFIISLACFIVAADRAESQPVRGAFPSPSVQILPMMVAQEKGFYKRESLDLELVFVRGASTAVQALLANQIHFIFSVGPQMPAVWEGADIMLLAQQVGRPTFSLVVTPDIQRIADLKGRKIGVTFGGSTAAGTKALLDLNKINPDKDVEYIGLPGKRIEDRRNETRDHLCCFAGAACRFSGNEVGYETARQSRRRFQRNGVHGAGRYEQDHQGESADGEADGSRHRPVGDLYPR